MTSTILRMSTLFLRTLRDDPADEDIASAKLLIRAGYIRKAAPGIFTWLPLGLRVLNKIEAIVREEIEKTGAQEVHLPALLPKEAYEATGRWEEYGDNMFKLSDRHHADYLLAPTHEEMFTLLVKDMYSSYKDLPTILYQIQTKYRDEARPRAGLIRGREFIMKDAYSFTIDEEGMQQIYHNERDAYERIFKRLDLKYIIVHAVSGPMGGSESEEFLAPLSIGEDTFAQAPSGKAWNVEALTTPQSDDQDYTNIPQTRDIEISQSSDAQSIAEEINSAAISSDYSSSQQQKQWTAANVLKNIIISAHYPDGHDELIAIGIPGDRSIDMKRVEASLAPAEVSIATAEELAQYPDLIPGFIGPKYIGPQAKNAGSKNIIRYLLDNHIARGTSWITGADKKGFQSINMVFGRDFDVDGRIEAVEIQHGDMSPDGSGPLSFERGVEIGQVFQLGLKYSTALDLKVLNNNGKAVPVWMGCYGIGISRVLACIAQSHHDEKGLAWPAAIAPADIHVIVTGKNQEAWDEAEKFISHLNDQGVEVLYDDRRKVSPGVKFKDAELLGVPLIAVIGRDFMQDNTIELRQRDGTHDEHIAADEAVETVVNRVKS